MKCRVFQVLTGLSLLLGVATIAAWIISYRTVLFADGPVLKENALMLGSDRGSLVCPWIKNAKSDFLYTDKWEIIHQPATGPRIIDEMDAKCLRIRHRFAAAERQGRLRPDLVRGIGLVAVGRRLCSQIPAADGRRPLPQVRL